MIIGFLLTAVMAATAIYHLMNKFFKLHFLFNFPGALLMFAGILSWTAWLSQGIALSSAPYVATPEMPWYGSVVYVLLTFVWYGISLYLTMQFRTIRTTRTDKNVI